MYPNTLETFDKMLAQGAHFYIIRSGHVLQHHSIMSMNSALFIMKPLKFTAVTDLSLVLCGNKDLPMTAKMLNEEQRWIASMPICHWGHTE